jgi:NADPH:quinone reductase
MKAVVVNAFGPLDTAGVEERPDPAPGAGEVVLDVVAAEANYPDILVVEGNYQVKPPLPFSPGKAAAGVVSMVGESVSGLAVGDRVAAQVEYGAYAEKLVARRDSVFKLPNGMDFVTAAALGLTYQTSYFALQRRGRLKPGETVLVLGASGGIGVASIQLAGALGAACVIGAVRSKDDAAIARQAGASHVILVDRPDLGKALREEVWSHTDGRGADIVIDPVGGAVTEAAFRAVAWEGRLVIVGFAAGEVPAVRANYLLVKNIEVSGLQWSDYRDRTPELVAEAQAEIFRLAGAGKLEPIVSATYPFADFAQALSLIRDGKAQGKIILEVGQWNRL